MAILACIVLLFGFVVFFGAPYLPSKRGDLKRAFSKLRPVTKHDVVVDIGSGDGIVLREAARRGAKAIGYELNPALVLIARLLSFGNKRVEVHVANAWKVQLPSDVTLVYAFVVERDEAKLANLVQRECNRLGRPLQLVSYGYSLKTKKPDTSLAPHDLYTFVPQK